MYRASDTAIADTKRWEEFVGYPYDDKVPKRRIDGVLRYPEWTGGPIVGTITIAYGHTDKAGAPMIVIGMRASEAEACEILRNDLAPVERMVNRAIKVKISQHQYDALVIQTFNCPSALPHVAALINAGNDAAVPAKMLEFVYSHGEHMRGLVNRRNAEIALWNTPDDPHMAEVDETFSPKAEREPPPKDARSSKTIAAGSMIGSAGALEAISSANDAAETVKAARDNLQDFGAVDFLMAASHSPFFWVGVTIIACAGFVIWDRHRKLTNDHI